MPRGDLAQPFQVSHRRRQHPGRTREGLHDHRRDGLGSPQRHDPFQVVREIGARRRLAAGEGRSCKIEGMRQMVHARQDNEGFRVPGDPADRDAAESDAMIAPLTADEAAPALSSKRMVVRQGDLQGAVDRL